MKILHILDVSFPDLSGYATRSHNIVTHQKAIGLEPVVLTSPKHKSNIKYEVIGNINYYRTLPLTSNLMSPLPFVNDYRLVRAVRKRILEVMEEENIDILHAHSPSLLGLAALQAGKKKGCKTIYEIRAFWEDAAVASRKYSESSTKYKLVRSLETYVCRHADTVITIADGLKNDLVKRGIPSKKVFKVPNGVDHNVFVPTNRDKILYDKLPLGNKVVIGYIGSFFDFEGIEDMIHVMADLQDECDNVVFLLVGGGENEKQISEVVLEKKITNVVYVGRVRHQEVIDYYTLMDIMVYPRKSSRITELTTPLKPLEAMSMGIPVICSSAGGLKELVGQENALFFSPGNRKELKDCCLQMINDTSLREKFVDRGKNWVLLEKRWEDIIRKNKFIYDL